jgi:hypothetical protein
MDAGAAGFYRTTDRFAPHNVYGDTDVFLEAADDPGPPPAQFRFARDAAQVSAAASGRRAERIALGFPSSDPSWSWTGEAWARSEGSSDATTTDGGRIEATNVVVVRVRVRDTGATDPGGNPVPETVLTGSGDAVVCSAGRSLAATWSKDEVDSVLELVDSDGEPVLLAPGNTWVEMVPASGSSVSIS